MTNEMKAAIEQLEQAMAALRAATRQPRKKKTEGAVTQDDILAVMRKHNRPMTPREITFEIVGPGATLKHGAFAIRSLMKRGLIVRQQFGVYRLA